MSLPFCTSYGFTSKSIIEQLLVRSYPKKISGTVSFYEHDPVASVNQHVLKAGKRMQVNFDAKMGYEHAGMGNPQEPANDIDG